MSRTRRDRVLVLGSVVQDRVARVPRLPRPGESLIGSGYYEAPGGKGANQAIAARRMGAAVRFIGCVGNDASGERQRQGFAAEGIDVSALRATAEAPTGSALILVADSGENQIALIPGANLRAGAEELEALEAALPEACVLLLQLEIPLAVNVRAAELAARWNVPVVLDPAPAQALPDDLLRRCALLTPNATEAEGLTGLPVQTSAQARAAARALIERGVRQCIVKLDARGGWACLDGVDRAYEPLPVRAVDSVAAGDAFNGAFAAALAEGRLPLEALDWARAAGALAVTRAGAQPSLPTRADVLALLKEHGAEPAKGRS